jgi:hypothetical protein
MFPKPKIIDVIHTVFEKSKNTELDSVFLEKIEFELNTLARYFGCSKMQALFIAVIFTNIHNGGSINLTLLSRHFSCNLNTILTYDEELKELYNKGILIKVKTLFSEMEFNREEEFFIASSIAEAINENKPVYSLKLTPFRNTIDLLCEINKLTQKCTDNEITTSFLIQKVQKIVSENEQFPLIKYVKELNLKSFESFLFLYVIWISISNSSEIYLKYLLGDICDNESDVISYIQELLWNKNNLIKKKLIETNNTTSLDNISITLSQQSVYALEGFGLKVITEEKQQNNIILPTKIKEKHLFFNEKEGKEFELIKSILQEHKFKEIVNKLMEKNMPPGLTILFYGEPGTGKTEAVLQLARLTNRAIFKVDFSLLKDKYWGEAEKNYDQAFIQYEEENRNKERESIMFVNEIDSAMISRLNNPNSDISQTMNTIQTIFFERLENFKGIFIGTTNVPENLDNAYGRRFLFKVKFNQPENKIKSKIWKSKLPSLSIKECDFLSEKFDFSGGEIENIVRKKDMHEVSGTSIDFDTIVSFCNDEKLPKKKPKRIIGFDVKNHPIRL